MMSAYLVERSVQLNPLQPYGTVFPYVLRSPVVSGGGENLNDLIERVKSQQCRDSFEKIFGLFYGKLLSYFKQGPIEGQKAQDLAQEALLVVWYKASFFDASKGSLSGWIFTIARNLKFDHFRGLKTDAMNFASEDIYATEEYHGVETEIDFLNSEVLHHIDKLPIEQGETIRALYYEGLSQVEFAKLKNIPLGTVKSRVRLALVQIRKSMEEL